MTQGKSICWKTILAIIITAIVAGGGVYYFQKSSIPAPEQVMIKETTEGKTSGVDMMQASQKSLVEYYQTRNDFETLGKDNSFAFKNPEELGMKELSKVKVACPPNPDGPCGADLLILSKESLHSGNQEFYLSQLGGAGYAYYGPFTDDLERLIEEGKTIDSLKEVY